MRVPLNATTVIQRVQASHKRPVSKTQSTATGDFKKLNASAVGATIMQTKTNREKTKRKSTDRAPIYQPQAS